MKLEDLRIGQMVYLYINIDNIIYGPITTLMKGVDGKGFVGVKNSTAHNISFVHFDLQSIKDFIVTTSNERTKKELIDAEEAILKLAGIADSLT